MSPTASIARPHPRRSEPPEGHVLVGHVLGAWGVRGDVRVRPATDAPDRFAPGNTVHLDGAPARIERVRPSRGTLIVKLDALKDRTAAEAARGRPVTIPQESLRALPPGSYYHFHIIEMEVCTEDGRRLGTVGRIMPTGDVDVYAVSDGAGGEMLVPATEEYVLGVDVQANRMTVRLPETVA